MDKKTAFKILHLNDAATFEQAKKAFHTMAKKYHPDVANTNHGFLQNSEERMKEINLAFCYLAPFLKSISRIQEPGGKPKKQENTSEIKTSEKNKNSFFHNIFDSLSKAFANKQKNHNFTKDIKEEKSGKNAGNRQSGFNDILKNAHHGTHPNKKRKQGKHKRRSYKTYQDYMMLQKKIKRGQSRTNQTMDIGKVEKIHPIRPVNPVGRN